MKIKKIPPHFATNSIKFYTMFVKVAINRGLFNMLQYVYEVKVVFRTFTSKIQQIMFYFLPKFVSCVQLRDPKNDFIFNFNFDDKVKDL